ncbi:MAG TPA: hypothetical protein VHM48_07295, partial [Candidatus Limnocylindrales bacterium]|nr:hypothetical protein [Candidatus Limnocylindrales bacterium]
MMADDEVEAAGAHRRILVRLSLPEHPHHGRPDAGKGSRAELAPRAFRDPLEEAPQLSFGGIATRQKVAPERFIVTCGLSRRWHLNGHGMPLTQARSAGIDAISTANVDPGAVARLAGPVVQPGIQ